MSFGLQIYDQYGNTTVGNATKFPVLVAKGTVTIPSFLKRGGGNLGAKNDFGRAPIGLLSYAVKLPYSVSRGIVKIQTVRSSINTKCVGILSNHTSMYRLFIDRYTQRYTFSGGGGQTFVKPEIDPKKWMRTYDGKVFQSGRYLHIDGSSIEGEGYSAVGGGFNGVSEYWEVFYRDATVDYEVYEV